jgi:hypothetical protein
VGEGATLLKVKLDDHLISERLIAIREAVPQATLIVDANESWPAMAWPRAVSCWRISAWRCWSSRFRRRRCGAGKFYPSAAHLRR